MPEQRKYTDSERMKWLTSIASKGNWPMLYTYKKSGKFLFSFTPLGDPKDRVWCDTLEQAIDAAIKAAEEGGGG